MEGLRAKLRNLDFIPGQVGAYTEKGAQWSYQYTKLVAERLLPCNQDNARWADQWDTREQNESLIQGGGTGNYKKIDVVLDIFY